MLRLAPSYPWWVLMWTYSVSVGAAEQALPGLVTVLSDTSPVS